MRKDFPWREQSTGTAAQGGCGDIPTPPGHFLVEWNNIPALAGAWPRPCPEVPTLFYDSRQSETPRLNQSLWDLTHNQSEKQSITAARASPGCERFVALQWVAILQAPDPYSAAHCCRGAGTEMFFTAWTSSAGMNKSQHSGSKGSASLNGVAVGNRKISSTSARGYHPFYSYFPFWR